MNKVNILQMRKLNFQSKRIIFIIIIFLISSFTITNCSSYQKRYNYYAGEHLSIFYPKSLDLKYIQDLSCFISREASLFYEYFLPEFKASDGNAVILIDTSPQSISVELLKSINKKSPIMNFNQLLLGEFDHTVYIDEDAEGLNLMGTNFIFLKKSKYDSIESLASIYIAELSHILLFRNTMKNGIRVDNKYDYISEYFTNIISRIYMPGITEYSFHRVRVKLDDILLKEIPDIGYEYPYKLKDPDNFRVEKIYNYIDDFLYLFHIMMEDELAYEKFKKTMVELFLNQYYTVDNNTIDQPFFNNYGKTIEQLILSWKPGRM